MQNISLIAIHNIKHMKNTQERQQNTLHLWNKLDFMQQYRASILQSDIEKRIAWLLSSSQEPHVWTLLKERFLDTKIDVDVDEIHTQVLTLAQFIQIESTLADEYTYFIEYKTFSANITSIKSLIASYIETMRRTNPPLAAKLQEKSLWLFFFEQFLKDKNNLTALLEAKKYRDNLPIFKVLWYY